MGNGMTLKPNYFDANKNKSFTWTLITLGKKKIHKCIK